MPEYATGGIVEPDPEAASGEPPAWLTRPGCPEFLMNAAMVRALGDPILERLNEES